MPAMGADKGRGTVCVTGSWELLGSWIVRLLLQRGYAVRCGIRLTPEEAGQLMSYPGAEDRLELLQVDVLNHASLAKLINGCSSVIHSPAPHDMNGMCDYPADMIEYEVKGTLNVVEACANASSVSRLILTSCLSAIVYIGQRQEDEIFDEKCWSNLELCREQKLWSPLAKTLAERAAWALALDKGLDMVVLNPATVVGPKNNGVQGLDLPKEDQVLAYIHVEDLAMAHIVALEKPNATGRYICFENVILGSKVKRTHHRQQILSNKKLLALGVKPNTSTIY